VVSLIGNGASHISRVSENSTGNTVISTAINHRLRCGSRTAEV
jgi:hypothetical protein